MERYDNHVAGTFGRKPGNLSGKLCNCYKLIIIVFVIITEQVVQLKRRLLRFVSSFYHRTKSQRIFTV